MQDLTFGEQVKIVLSRKNMTIKELAKQIEIRTRKKMSRQNLTQRLGRDNFQEQDMRMIAEILECPFQLNILDDSMAAEKTELEIKPRGSIAAEEPAEKAEGLTAAEEPAEKAEGLTAEKESAETVESAEGLSEAGESTGVKAEAPAETEAKESRQGADEKNANEKSTGETAHERDITIGELVDIHKELDAMMIEKATGELPKVEVHLADSKDEIQTDSMQETDIYPEPVQEDSVSELYGENGDEELTGTDGEPVEKILEEIENLEKEVQQEKKTEKAESQEEKARGWRAYFMQRLKKRGKEQLSGFDGHAVRTEAEREEYHGPSEEETYYGGYVGQEENLKKDSKDYIEGGYLKDIYLEDTYDEDRYQEESYQESYEEGGYSEGNYISDEYIRNGYAGEYQRGYENAGYDREVYGEDVYGEDMLQEEEPAGDFNPYTGKEYESNSVRMHPSRIGYVQVYDRSNHQWTDMTEWAFLGYQERKKQLLGKDYDPPIYLD